MRIIKAARFSEVLCKNSRTADITVSCNVHKSVLPQQIFRVRLCIAIFTRIFFRHEYKNPPHIPFNTIFVVMAARLHACTLHNIRCYFLGTSRERARNHGDWSFRRRRIDWTSAIETPANRPGSRTAHPSNEISQK